MSLDVKNQQQLKKKKNLQKTPNRTIFYRAKLVFVMSPRCSLAPGKLMQDEGHSAHIVFSLYQQTWGSPWEWMISILLLTCSNHSAFSFHRGWVRGNLDYDYALTRIWNSDHGHFDKYIHLHHILAVWMAKLIFWYWFLVFPIEKITCLLSG